MLKKPKLTTFSVRLTEDQRKAIQAIADRVGHGATPTGVIMQAINDLIAKHEG